MMRMGVVICPELGKRRASFGAAPPPLDRIGSGWDDRGRVYGETPRAAAQTARRGLTIRTPPPSLDQTGPLAGGDV